MHHPRTLSFALTALMAAGALSTPAPAGQVRPARQAPPAGREVVTPSGLRYTDLKVGSGDEAAHGKIVEVHYTGWLENGTKFESSRDRDRDQPFTFRLGAGDVIKGWDEGLAGMRVGGKRKLVVPAELGFGKQGAGGVVPPNSTLLYEFELLAVR
jgi:FKBP-type peptidyl-prolyl cis-trans isomerase